LSFNAIPNAKESIMARRSCGLLAGLLLLFAVSARGADEITPGNYKVTMLGAGQQLSFWLVKLEEKNGKWTGEVVSTTDKVKIPKTTVSSVAVKDGTIKLTLQLEDDKFTFEGKLPPSGKKILGSLMLDRLQPAQLELTTLKSLDSFELAKDTMTQANATGPEIFDAAGVLLRKATEKEAKPEEVRTWATKAIKAAEGHGPRWQLDVTLRLAEALAGQEKYAAEAVTYARMAERQLTPGTKPGIQKRALMVLAAALRSAKKDDEAKEIEARADKIPYVAVSKFPPRKGKNDDVVLVELFTGAECPPCVAADLAFDALGKGYTPKEVILLQYHIHIPGPDPLTNEDTETRQKFYGDDIEGAPTIFFNGKTIKSTEGGGGKDNAQDKYDTYVEALAPLLEKPGKAKVQLTAVKKGAKIEISGNVSDIEKANDKLRLRFALVEESVKYTGRNKLDTHHHVVRALPGGAEGFAIKELALKQSVTVDVEELKKKLKTYLDKYAEENPFPNKDRPLELKNLRVVAFVQDNGTKEVLQAAQVEVKAEE